MVIFMVIFIDIEFELVKKIWVRLLGIILSSVLYILIVGWWVMLLNIIWEKVLICWCVVVLMVGWL